MKELGLEKEKIIETISAIFKCADERNWGKVQKALEQNVWQLLMMLNSRKKVRSGE